MCFGVVGVCTIVVGMGASPDPDDPVNNMAGVTNQCPWDCGGDNDQNVGIVDFLALLGQWTQVGTSCDFDGGGVGIVDFLDLLAHWGPCP